MSLAAGAAVVVGIPQIIAMAQQVAAHGASAPATSLAQSYNAYGVGLLGLFAPSPNAARFGLTRLASEYYYHGIVYHHHGPHELITSNEGTPMFGLVLTILGLAGLVACWRRLNAWLLALLWLAAAALSLGPVLWIGVSHEYVPLAEIFHGVRVSAIMPYTLFVQIPGMSSFREADRLAILGLLAAALLAGSAVDWLRYHVRPTVAAVAAIAVVLAISVPDLGWSGNPPAQVMPKSLQKGTMPTTMPRLDGPIAADHSRSIVVDFPFGLRGGIPDYGPPFAPEAQVLATADGHPIADGFLSRRARAHDRGDEQAPVLRRPDQHLAPEAQPAVPGARRVLGREADARRLGHRLALAPAAIDRRLPGAHRIQARLQVGPVPTCTGSRASAWADQLVSP